jgi:hypothetical protein
MRRNLLTFTSILATAAVAVLPLSACIGSASTPRAAVATLLPSAPATTSLPSAPAAMVPARDELQSVLADAMLTDPAALCEWDVWGEAQQTLYVWAVCESASGAAVSAPAVVHLDVDGHVAGASLPGDGTGYGHDVRRLFPPGVQKRRRGRNGAHCRAPEERRIWHIPGR